MDERTEALRDIFVDVTDEETVTEQQAEARGSLAEREDSPERLAEVVASMRERFEFTTTLSDEELTTLVMEFYHGGGDASLADTLDISADEVFDARLDLHLVRETDTDAPFELDELEAQLEADEPVDEIATRLDVTPSTVRRYRRVLETRAEIQRVSDRFRSEFEDALGDADLTGQLTADVMDDGLEEATDGMETNVSF
ncbi:MAG: hypothetical protein ACI8UR_000134 [Natronomonas sp.]|jgi:hypothetical protein|uniref:conditioned medium-induced protein 4 n=1 Tax=Natronomonas sp. TaxID=2184060 RepID=UPI0039898799